jgi:hypothetical protein
VAYFVTLSQNVPAGTDKSHEKLAKETRFSGLDKNRVEDNTLCFFVDRIRLLF